jgi:uncharacterized protein YjbI with pentapeptide repeats
MFDTYEAFKAIERFAARYRAFVGSGETFFEERYTGPALAGADLGSANLLQLFLPDYNLSGARLPRANLGAAYLAGSDMRNTNLQFAVLNSANLEAVDLRGADMRGTSLRNTRLDSAKMAGARIEEGVIVDFVEGYHGFYLWHAFLIEDSTVVLQYGCERATLATWETRDAKFGTKHKHPVTHWSVGPAVAIAEAQSLRNRYKEHT